MSYRGLCISIDDGIGNHLDQVNWITKENIDEEIKRIKIVLLHYLDDYEEETSVDLSSFKQRIANGERAKDVIETYHVIGKLDRKELLEYEERFNKEE